DRLDTTVAARQPRRQLLALEQGLDQHDGDRDRSHSDREPPHPLFLGHHRVTAGVSRVNALLSIRPASVADPGTQSASPPSARWMLQPAVSACRTARDETAGVAIPWPSWRRTSFVRSRPDRKTRYPPPSTAEESQPDDPMSVDRPAVSPADGSVRRPAQRAGGYCR